MEQTGIDARLNHALGPLRVNLPAASPRDTRIGPTFPRKPHPCSLGADDPRTSVAASKSSSTYTNTTKPFAVTPQPCRAASRRAYLRHALSLPRPRSRIGAPVLKRPPARSRSSFCLDIIAPARPHLDTFTHQRHVLRCQP